MMKNTSVSLLVLLTGLAAAASATEDKSPRRLAACTEVLQEVLGIPENVPRDLLDRAYCVGIVPSVKKFALGVGGRYGKGAVVCRRDEGRGPWGPPLMITMGGGSVGLQIGGQANDFVFLVMNSRGVRSLLESQFTLGADVAVAAGPKGRTSEAATDIQMQAEILSYSRTHGLFAGLSIEGAVLKQDEDANERLYSEAVSPKRLLMDASRSVPKPARPLVDYLGEVSPHRSVR
ncbi:MAG TPA: lipid-binding SYLF domain-containing protein [Vicinamibacteria bacterium]|nr:lipid-binding SYLF domain-containing protein [Vicinamibacteria bacterium]